MSRSLRYGFGVLLLLAAGLAAAADASLRGTLLVAARDMGNTPFARTVILVIEHGDSGAHGLVLNRRTELSLADVLPGTVDADGGRDYPLYSGGPVRQHQLGILVRTTTPRDGVEQILPGVGHTAQASVFDAVLASGPDETGIRVFAGYAGWAPEQLESEIARDHWHILDATSALVFTSPGENLWQRMIERLPARSGERRSL